MNKMIISIFGEIEMHIDPRIDDLIDAIGVVFGKKFKERLKHNLDSLSIYLRFWIKLLMIVAFLGLTVLLGMIIGLFYEWIEGMGI